MISFTNSISCSFFITKTSEIYPNIFTESFDLPSEGLTSVNELPIDLINEARKSFSATGEPIKTSCKKKEMKIEFRLLNDILAKTVTAKADSFDAVTHERFLLMTAIHGGIKINWRILFNILKEMVTPSSKQARGFAFQLCILLKGSPDLTLGDSKPFPPMKFLNVKTVGTYIVVKRRTAPTAEPVAKKRCTTVGRAAPKEKDLYIVAVVQDAEPISVVPAGSPIVQRSQSPKQKLILLEETDEEVTENEETVEKEKDEKVDEEKVEEATDSEDTEPLRKVLKLTETSVSDEESLSIDEILNWVRSLIFIDESWIVVQGANPKPARFAWPFISKQKKQLPQRRFMDAFAPICVFIEIVQDLDSRRPYSTNFQRIWVEICTNVVQFSLFGHLQPVGSVNTCRDIISIDTDLDTESIPTGIFDAFQHDQSAEGFVDFFVQQIQIVQLLLVQVLPVQVRLLQVRLPVIPFRASIDHIQLEKVQTRDSIDELKAELTQKITKLELAFAQSIARQDMVFRAQINEVRQEVQIQKAALSQEMTDFRLETQECLSNLRAQLSEIITYINRGREDKKGEGSSSGP
ncbi:hypothetical protein F511_28509 [Dorcoceras hygrometricum]|uniref:Uncharacterized protein n=1 Tax=Dorcoceras hygrometricum TaxID=472368 RepID=A0A2Z7D2S1_9LAMI|nr:hypothetical protein F511_28509 [Dorcoceras hygrometricum]